MSCAALLERTPDPTGDDVKTAIGGHFCRCGVYPHVICRNVCRGQSVRGIVMAKQDTRTETFPISTASVVLGELTREIPVDEPPPLAPNAELAVIGRSVPASMAVPRSPAPPALRSTF
jgi:hypothetical protein